VQTAGADADEFTTSGDGCTGIVVLVGASCQVSVRFAPVATGAANAALRFVSNASNSPSTVSLTGTGTSAPAPPAGAAGPQGVAGAQGAPGTNGLNGAVGPSGAKGDLGPQGPAGKNGRDAVVTCKPGKAAGGKVKVTCTVRFTAASSSTRVRARISRGRHVFARGARVVTPGARGSVSLIAPRRLAHGSYTLLLTFVDAQGHQRVIRQRVTVR
jgi:hypothetical protein